MRMDSSADLLVDGYAWLPDRRRRSPDGIVETRLMGRPAIGLCGPEAARFFYDEANVLRHGAIPSFVRSTLFGDGAVHTLDGAAHRRRKSLFLSTLDEHRRPELVAAAGAAWDEAARTWAGRDVVLFDEAARVLARAVSTWAGVPDAPRDADRLARDCVAMVDGFATFGPRHWRAVAARDRQERRLAAMIEGVRDGRVPAAGEVVRAAADHEPYLPPRTAAVELLNVLRPTVAVAWFVAFSAHALHRWPSNRKPLAEGDPAFAEAFTHEVRRFYPFAPFVGGRAARDLTYRGHRVRQGSLVLLDLYGQNHDPALWPDPYAFAPERFVDQAVGAYDLVPQGGGDPATGHRCPGEGNTVSLLRDLAVRLARLDHTVPPQDLAISLRRIPARIRGGMVVSPRSP